MFSKIFRIETLAILLGLSLWGQAISDPDLGWQLVGGQWIYEHYSGTSNLSAALPPFDIINSFSVGWHDYHWLAQSLLYFFWLQGGFVLLQILAGLTLAFLLLATARTWRSAQSNAEQGIISIFLFLCLCWLVKHQMSVRPQLLSCCSLAWSILLIRGERKRFELALFFALTVLMANMHVYWVFMPFIWLVYRCEPRHSLKETWYGWLGFLVLGSAAFISPYGLFADEGQRFGLLSNYALLWDYGQVPQFLKQAIVEFQSPFKRSDSVFYVFCLLCAVLIRSLSLLTLKRYPRDALLGATGLLLAFKATKFLPIFALFILPLLAREAAKLDKQFFQHRGASLLRVAAGVLFASGCLLNLPFGKDPLQKARLLYPLEACAKIPELAKRDQNNHVRVATHFNHGGWCRWAAFRSDAKKDIRVSTDGRTQGIPGEHFQRSSELYRVKEGWQKTLLQ